MAIPFQNIFEKMLEACQLMNDNKNDMAKKIVELYILDNVNTSTKSEALLAHIIAESLLKRIDRRLLETKNIYLQEFDIPQIQLFYKMLEAYPHVAESHKIANQYLNSVLQTLEEATIFDIGIGKGKQVESLLRNLSKNKTSLKKIKIIALDPDPINISDSAKNINSLQDESNFEIEYYSYCSFLENLSNDALKEIKEIGSGNLLINSALSLHHIAHPINDTEFRTGIFRKIRSLEPLLFTIVEPNSDHDVENVSKRLYNCWRHFGTVFDLIDHSNIEPEHKFLIKNSFFGREMRDMFGVSDYLRSERHESIESWLMRLMRAGFEAYDFKNIKTEMPNYCTVNVIDGITTLGYKSIDLLGVIAYKPKN